MNRLRFGAREIIATLAGCALFVLTEWLEKYLIAQQVLPAEAYYWVQPRVLVITITAVFFGPLSGMFCGLAGDLLINTMFDPFVSYPEVIVLGFYGLVIGMYYGSIHYNSRQFTTKDFLDFNAVTVTVAIFCSMFFVPLSKFFTERSDIFNSITIGARSVVGNSILIGIVVPMIMAVVSSVKRARRRRV